MSGICRADQRQNSKHKAKFESQLKRNTWATHKDIRMAKHKKRMKKRAEKIASRNEAYKPNRGDARSNRRNAVM